MSKTPETYKSFQKGQIILKEGQINPVAYMIKKGAVSLYRVVNNRRVLLAQLKPGQVFGEMALITGEPFYATAEADELCECIVFDRIFLQSLILKCPNPIQRIMRQLFEQLRASYLLVHEQAMKDVFLSVCQLLELVCLASEGALLVPSQRATLTDAFSYVDFSRIVKNILVISQQEIDTVLETLNKINLIKIRDIKGATYKRDIFGQVSKSNEYLRDRIIVLTDRLNFMSTARNLRREMTGAEPAERTKGLDVIDIHDVAAIADADTSVIYRLIGRRQVPEGLLAFNRDAVRAWIESKGASFFSHATAQKPGLFELQFVDDIVYIEDELLRHAFLKLGPKKIQTLYAVAGEEARKKIRGNLSKKMIEIFEEDLPVTSVAYSEVAALEHELFQLVRAKAIE